MNKYRIKIDGKTYEMEIEPVDEKNDMNPSKRATIPSMVCYKRQPDNSVVSVMGSEEERSVQNSDNIVFSPLPGTITEIMVAVGDTVVAGETILILESMKMENEICAKKNGKIKTIFVNVRQIVPGNAPLFEIEMED